MSASDSSGMVMQGLKDFQRRTVDFVFSRMFDKVAPSRRFLVADEVGLGKTLVAKGLIARTIAHLQSIGTKRVDVIYVCSNADIAVQNVERLMQPGQSAFCGATRLTLLPLMTRRLREHAVNFISFTPGTTFTQNNRAGRKEERRLIYQMLREVDGIDRRGLRNAMKGAAGDTWDTFADEKLAFDADIAQKYRARVSNDESVMLAIKDVTDVYRDRRRCRTDAHEESCLALTGALRCLLAKTCLSELEPDLVILDEFQRFSELFDDPEHNASAELAHELFNYSDDLRVLLLSATPYKMYAADDDAENHYADFMRTLRFLMLDQHGGVAQLERDIGEFRSALLDVSGASDLSSLSRVKQRIEACLTRVMCRTERVGTTVRADAMVRECLLVPALKARDLVDFRTLDSIAQRLNEPETVEYWKSSPYLLNFMRDYELKKAVRADQNSRLSRIADLLAPPCGNALSSSAIESFLWLDPGNARLRTLLDGIMGQGLYRLLWMPPSLPYWTPSGVYEGVGSASKQLIFSAWNVVPDALAALVSYNIERQIVLEADERSKFGYAEMGKRFAARLRLARQADGRLTGMWNLMLMYPSSALATLVDPLHWTGEGGQVLSIDVVRARAAACLAPHIELCVDRSVEHGSEDRRWYWVVLARLEAALAAGARAWCADHWRRARHANDAGEHDADIGEVFTAHIDQWLAAWEGGIADLGRVPADLCDVLTALALGGPATCSLRALSRQAAFAAASGDERLSAAARIAEGMRSQFNSPRAIALLKGSEDDGSYWQKVLHYCVDGNLQAVLDEYTHLLTESVGAGQAGRQALDRVADEMVEALSLRTATLRPDEISVTDGRLCVKPFDTGIRCHFALRFGVKDDEEGGVARKKSVQAAFNSPFWPFVLVSTSVGQEGLDFHPWCHAVVHWNLPSNPVDMEQREGRVHRYKGYAVRKNLATSYGAAVRDGGGTVYLDPWGELFARGAAGRPAGTNDLVPFWIYEIDGGACIERRVMVMPMSREEVRYKRLKRSLALYRMVFAQPRQEDLLACLEQSIGEDRAAVVAAQWRINLGPEAVIELQPDVPGCGD